ncbi:MAG: pirin family protein [Burkholderiaceae bacterium]|nr:pirin family protein [Burkholderiaceae bacterium]
MNLSPDLAGPLSLSAPTLDHIAVRTAELGEGLAIGRALPTRQRRMVGAWCFLDHLGPVDLSGSQGMHVGAHPHTGLQTFTWMLEGQILHRDSLGSEQVIRPGQVHLMTAGRGIAHTEDSLPGASRLHAAQLWIALPPDCAEVAPAFDHYPHLPAWTQDGVCCTLLAGAFAGHVAPTRLYSPLVGLDLASAQAGQTVLALEPGFEYALLPLEGRVHIGGEAFDARTLAYLGTGRASLGLGLEAGSRCLLLGGTPWEVPITMWWNFVGPSRASIAQAQADWAAGSPRFGPVPGGEDRRLAAPPWPWGSAR